MKRFIGTKLIAAMAMTHAAYNDFRGWTMPENETDKGDGYLVEYLDGGKPNVPSHDGYVSWSPKDVFEAAYRPCHQMTFGLAVEALKRGDTVARTGWNGRGMFIYLVPANAYPAQTGAAKAHFGTDALVPYNAYMALVGVDGAVSTWVPSVTDTLAEDWAIVGIAAPAEAPIEAAPASTRPPYQQRVVDERTELLERTNKLAAFLVTPTFDRLADEEQTRLRDQLEYMVGYDRILSERIAAFPQ